MRPIQAGDLVMVVRGLECCGDDKWVGKVFVVATVMYQAKTDCTNCKTVTVRDCATTGEFLGFRPRAVELSRLIRIDPPALPESVETDREVTA